MQKKIFFLTPILLALFILYCSMSFTDILLERQMDSILGEQGEITLPTILDNADNSVKLAKEELAGIAKSYSEDREWLLHDPLSGQLSMEEALKISSDTVDSFIDAGILPHNFENILSCNYKATLGTKKYERNSNVIMSPQFSWWVISFSGDDVLLEVYLNATTGKIMKLTANMGEKQETPIDLENLIESYLNYLEIQNVEYKLEKRNGIVYLELSELDLSLVIDISNLDDDYYYSINLYFE